MPIDTTRLEKVKKLPNGNVTARCPACAQQGGDQDGIHLIVFQDGRFGCVAAQGDKMHRKAIFKLCGVKADNQRLIRSMTVRYEGW